MKKVDYIISGMGGAGMSTAIELALAEKSVLLICDRDGSHLRMQKLFLDLESRAYLLSLHDRVAIHVSKRHKAQPKDLEHPDPEQIHAQPDFESRLRAGRLISIKDVERYLDQLLGKLINSGCGIDTMKHGEIASYDLSSGIAKVITNRDGDENQPSLFEFQYIIGADGEKHHVANLYNDGQKGNKQKGGVIYEPQINPPEEYHFSAYLSISRKDEGKMKFPTRSDMIDLYTEDNKRGFLCFISFDKTSHDKSKQLGYKCYIVGETDQTSYETFKEEPDTKDKIIPRNIVDRIVYFLVKYGVDINIDELEVTTTPGSKKYGAAKDKLKIMFFTVDAKQATSAVYSKGDRSLILAGDSFRSPNYQVSRGFRDALHDARTLGQLVSKNHVLDLRAYDDSCKTRRKETTASVERMNKAVGAARADITKKDNIFRALQERNDDKLAKIRATLKLPELSKH